MVNCGCGTAAGCARWVAIFLLLAVGVAISVFHTLEVNECVTCETRPNEDGELEEVCDDYKGRDMNWSGLKKCSRLTLILTTVGFLLSFALVFVICICMACLPSPGGSKSLVKDAQKNTDGNGNAKQDTNSSKKDSTRTPKPTALDVRRSKALAVAIPAGNSGSSANEAVLLSPSRNNRFSAPSPHYGQGRRSDGSGRTRGAQIQQNPQSPARASQHGRHEQQSPVHSSPLGRHEPQTRSPGLQEVAPKTGGTHQEASTSHDTAEQPQQTPGSYPVDAWLEGKENLESGDDPLAPIHKVESLMNGIALKEIVSQAPENPTATETNSMHADFGDTYTTMNTNTQTAIGVNGDTYTSNPGVAGDTYTNTPPRSPRGTSVHTSGVGRPPILTSGQLQPASMQSTGNYGYSTGANMLTSMGNTTAEPESRTKPEARGFVPEMMSSPTSGQVRQGAPAPFAAAGHAELSPARDVLDLSPRPSVGLDGRSSKMSYGDETVLTAMTGQDIWTKDHTEGEYSTMDSTKAAYRDSSMLAVHAKKGDMPATAGNALAAAVAAAAAAAAAPAALESAKGPVNASGDADSVAAHGDSYTRAAAHMHTHTKSSVSEAEAAFAASAAAMRRDESSRVKPSATIDAAFHEEHAAAVPGMKGAVPGPHAAVPHVSPTEPPDELHNLQERGQYTAADALHAQPQPQPKAQAQAQASMQSGEPLESSRMTARQWAQEGYGGRPREPIYAPDHDTGSTAATVARSSAGAVADVTGAGTVYHGVQMGTAAVGDVAVGVDDVGGVHINGASPGDPPPIETLSGAAGDRDEAQLVWGWSGADKGWAKVPQDLEVVQKPPEAAPAPAYVAPPVRRTQHWLMMDKVASSELKEAGMGSGSGSFWDGSGKLKKEKKKRSAPARHTGKAQVEQQQSIPEHGAVRGSAQATTSAGAGKVPVRGRNSMQGGSSIHESSVELSEPACVIGMPGPPVKPPLQKSGIGMQQSTNAAQASARSKPTFGWKALGKQPGKDLARSRAQQGGNRAVAVKGKAEGKTKAEGKGKVEGKGKAEKTGPSRGRANILGWLSRGEAAMQDDILHKQGPMDSLDSDYQLNSEDRRAQAERKMVDKGGAVVNGGGQKVPKGGSEIPLKPTKGQLGEVGNDSEGEPAGMAKTSTVACAESGSEAPFHSRVNPYFTKPTTNPYTKTGRPGKQVQGLDSNGSVLSARGLRFD